MWCRSFSNQLSALVDGELAPARARQVREHLRQCPRCAEEYSVLQSVVQLTRAVPLEASPAGLASRTMTRLAYVDLNPAPGVARRRSVAPLWLWGPALAGAAVSSLALVLSQTGSPSRGRTVEESAVPPVAAQLLPPVAPETATPVLPRPGFMVQKAPERAPQPERMALTPKIARPAPELSTPSAAGERSAVERVSVPPSVLPVKPKRTVRTPAHPAPAVTDEARESRGGAPMGTAEKPDAAPGTGLDGGAPASSPIMAVPAPKSPAEGDGAGAVETMMAGVDRESTMRMAGFTPDPEPPSSEDEGAQALRMFLNERNRMVPQPPLAPGRERRMRKPL